jgi:hypothetical protein
METYSFRPRGRTEMGWEDNVKYELKTIKTFHWKKQEKCRNEQKRITERAKIHIELERRKKKKVEE